MNTANLNFRFLGLGRIHRAEPDEDPADMGTCFGLDMSLEFAPKPDKTQTDPPMSAAWWRRLADRRRRQN